MSRSCLQDPHETGSSSDSDCEMETASAQTPSMGSAQRPQSQIDLVAMRSAEQMTQVESESDTDSVGSRPPEARSQRRRLVLMSSRTVATAMDFPDSHEERFQRVRRAMQTRPAVEALEAVRMRVTAQARSKVRKQVCEDLWTKRSRSGLRHCGPHF